jgi:putative addiction module component (TIGR02574 family)
MTQRERTVLREALALPKNGRARLASQLMASLDERPDPDVEKAWAVEIERRAKDVISGKAKLVDADVAIASARRKLRRLRRK